MKRARRAALLIFLLVPAGTWAGTAARVVAGGAVGLAAGTGVSVGIVVARARLGNRYLESVRDILGWQGAPIPLGLVAGGTAGVLAPGALAGATVGAVAGAGIGAAAGAAIGASGSSDIEDVWAGGVMGGALGILLGVLAGALIVRRRRRSPTDGPDATKGGPGGSRTATVGGALLVLLPAALASGGCGDTPGTFEDLEVVERTPLPADPAPVEDVVILVGDPGKARFRHYPVFPRVAAEVEAWAERIGRDSAVSVLVLGDIVYPDGMHDPGSPEFAEDSARVMDQVAMVETPAALTHDARMYFMAGNHDWGLHEDREGARRLRNLGAFLDRVRERGANVDLAPAAGSGVPDVVDIGERLRLILLDTAWWLFDAEPRGKEAMVEAIAEAMAGAGDRRVVIAAHHPWQSAGPHGGFFPVWQGLGVRTLLFRSGALLQDLNSRPYRELRRALREVFAEHGRPLVFAGGHEHSLQVMRHDTPAAPRYSVVSGSASKLTGVGMIPGTLFQSSAPGYIQLVVRENGAVDLEVVAAPDRFLACPENEPDELEWERCMAEGEASFRTLYATRLEHPGAG